MNSKANDKGNNKVNNKANNTVNNKTNNKANSKRIVMVIGSAIVSIYLIVLLINILKKPTATFIVEDGKIYQEEATEGYIIRSENLINISDSDNGIVAIKGEGEKVAKGESIYRYCIDNEDDINNKINEVDKQIQDSIDKDEEYFPADVKLINTQIDARLDTLYESNDLKKISQNKADINTYLTKKLKIRAAGSSNQELKALLAKREDYEKQLKNNSKYVYADNSGVISYRVDGLEDTLKNDDFSYLSEEYLKNLNLETGKMIASTTDYGKIVDNFKCNIACVLSSEEAKNCTVGKSIKIRLQDSQEIPAKIVDKGEQTSGKQLIVFEVSSSVVDLIKYRKIAFDVIWWSYSGLKIPNSAIKHEGDFAYVIRNRAGLKEKIIIKILKTNDKYSIVENYTYTELKEAGYDMTTLSTNRKLISIHDQIEN